MAYMAKDSISIVMTALYIPPAPAEVPMAFRMFLWCIPSRMTIMSMRRRLSEREIDQNAMPKSNISVEFVNRLPGFAST
jgi:hypothetical protein